MKRNIKNLKQAEKLVAQARRLHSTLTEMAYFNRSERLNKVVEHAHARMERRREIANALYAANRAKLYA